MVQKRTHTNTNPKEKKPSNLVKNRKQNQINTNKNKLITTAKLFTISSSFTHKIDFACTYSRALTVREPENMSA